MILGYETKPVMLFERASRRTEEHSKTHVTMKGRGV